MKIIDITGTGFDQSLEPDYSWVMPTTHIGIELEVEGLTTSAHDKLLSKYWRRHADGSLRGANAEWVTVPVFGKDLTRALESMEQWLQHSPHRFSYRCGLHVHMNITDLQFTELRAFFTAYLLSESFLFRVAGNDRVNNPYCVPFTMSTSFLNGLAYLGSSGGRWAGASEAARFSEQLNNAVSGGAKYQALNILPIMKMGTVEFRHALATDDMTFIKNWINLLMCIKRAAIRYSAEDLASMTSADVFINNVFPEYAPMLMSGDFDAEFSENYTAAKTFASAVRLEDRVSSLSLKPKHKAFKSLATRRAKYVKDQQAAKKTGRRSPFEEGLETEPPPDLPPNLQDAIRRHRDRLVIHALEPRLNSSGVNEAIIPGQLRGTGTATSIYRFDPSIYNTTVTEGESE